MRFKKSVKFDSSKNYILVILRGAVCDENRKHGFEERKQQQCFVFDS